MNQPKPLPGKYCFIFFIALCFCLCHCFSPVKAQAVSEKGLPFITNYPIKDYQAHPQNWAIIEDNRGIMYFGNSICLLEYDGVKWRKLNFGNNTLIRSLAKDKKWPKKEAAYSNRMALYFK